MAAADRMLDTEDPRLTAGERRYLRQIVFRLQNGEAAQPAIHDRIGSVTALEEAIAEVFGSSGKVPSD